jgi:hypothetical protein
MEPNSVVCWWSGGITSATAGRLAVDLFGKEACRFIMIDTKNEDSDTYRFKKDCESWYGLEIETITAIGEKYDSIEAVWDKYRSLNNATGAVCSSELKRAVRVGWQKENSFTHQVFGFEHTKKEAARAIAMSLNWPDAKPIYPLLMYGLDKKDCIKIVEDAGLTIPRAYSLGFHNNNCLNTGCVQGGIGYWQKMKKYAPEIVIRMGHREHKYTNERGEPVTILKDQSKYAKEKGLERVFLVKHPEYPELRCIDDFPEMEIKSLIDCNGFCGTNDLLNDDPQMVIFK